MFLVTCSWPSWRLVTVATAIRLCRSPTPVGHHEPCANRVLVCLFFLYRVFLGATRRPLVRRGDGPERRGCIFFGCHGRIFFFLLFFFLFEDRGRSGRLVGRQETRGQTRITEPGSVFDEACAFLESGSRRRPTRAAAGVFGSTFSLTFQPHCLVNDVVGRETRLDAAATPAGPPSTPAPPHEQPHRPRAAMGCDSDRWLAAIRIAFHWQPVERLSTRPVRRIAVRQQKKRRKETTERFSLNNDGLRLGLATPRHPRYERKRKGRVAPRRLCRERPTTRPRPAPVIAVRRLGAGPQPSDADRVQRRWR